MRILTALITMITIGTLSSCASTVTQRSGENRISSLCKQSDPKMVLDFTPVNAWLACKETMGDNDRSCSAASEITFGGQVAFAANTTFGSDLPDKQVPPTVNTVAALVDRMKTWPDVSKEVVPLFSLPINGCVQVFVVANGHPWGDAYVRTIIRDGEKVVLSTRGEPVAILNALLIAGGYSGTPTDQAESAYAVLRHEVFHIFFERYRRVAPKWKGYRQTKPLDELAVIILNEGIAHLIGRKGNYFRNEIPRDKAEHAFKKLDTAIEQLSNANTSSDKVAEILRAANQGRYWEKYGSISGMVLAQGVFQSFEQSGLQEAIKCGPGRLIQLYQRALKRVENLPQMPSSLASLSTMDLCHQGGNVESDSGKR